MPAVPVLLVVSLARQELVLGVLVLLPRFPVVEDGSRLVSEARLTPPELTRGTGGERAKAGLAIWLEGDKMRHEAKT